MSSVKVFKRMGFQIDNESVQEVVNCRPGAIEAVLMTVQEKVRRPYLAVCARWALAASLTSVSLACSDGRLQGTASQQG